MNEKLSIKIALADDHILLVDSFEQMMFSMGYNVVLKAYNGKELIDKLEKCTELPDVCLLDINMPVMDGYQTLLILTKRHPDIKVLVLSVIDMPHIVTKMLMEGAKGYLEKSSTLKQINEAIIAVHKNGVYFSPLVTKQYWNAIQKGMIKLPNLTATEIQILKYSCTDLTYEQISQELKITENSVRGHRDSIFKKLSINSRVGLVRFAIENGIELVDIPSANLEKLYSKKNNP